MRTKKEAPEGPGAEARTQTHQHPQYTKNDAVCQDPTGYVIDAKRHIDFILALMKMDDVSDDVHLGHVHAFADIFINALVDPERDVLCEYIRDCIGELPADRQARADRVFFGTTAVEVSYA